MKIFRELEFIRTIRQKFNYKHPNLVLGISDDTAIIKPSPGEELLFTCDLMTEGIHFSLDYFQPEDIGWRALAANLSDIASMGGHPMFFTLSVAVPPYLKKGDFLDRFMDGIYECSEKFDVKLIGGDTSSSKSGLFIDIAMIGGIEEGKALRRSGAKPGDLIYITGDLGKAEAGLQLFLAGWRLLAGQPFDNKGVEITGKQGTACIEVMTHHIRPVPLLKEGRMLCEAGIPSAMIDTSDGLSTDLSHICEESGTGALIDYSLLNESFFADLKDLYPAYDPKYWILNGGEDYELLFTVPPEKISSLDQLQLNADRNIPRRIGIITDKKETLELRLPDGVTEHIIPAGWQHT